MWCFDDFKNRLLSLCMASQNPGRLDYRNTHLKRLLILNARSTRDATCCLGAGWRGRGRSAHKVGGVDLYLLATFRSHVPQSHLCVFKEYWILHVAKADRDARSVRHCMRTNMQNVGRECPSSRPQDQLKRVLSVELKSGQLRGSIREW